MERRSRSTTRHRQQQQQNQELSQSHQSQPNLNRDSRHSSIGRSFPEIPTNSSLLHRVGGDSRTLSPERKSYGFPKTSPHHSMNKSGSYNVYTHGQPPPIPPPPSHGLSHAASAIALGVNGTSNNPIAPPPRAPVTTPPSKTSNNNNKQGGERIVWEYHQVLLERVPGYGFGIAVSGGRDNPHFTNGDPSIAISDVLKSGPAEGKLLINDRVISANNLSLEGVDYATAVQVLRDSGQSVNLVVKRRLVLPPTSNNANGQMVNNGAQSSDQPQQPINNPTMKVILNKNHKKKEDFGLVLGCKIYIKEIMRPSLAEKEFNLAEGDLINSINGLSLDGMTLKEARKMLETVKEKLELVITKNRDSPQPPSSSDSNRTTKAVTSNSNNKNIETNSANSDPKTELEEVGVVTASALSTPSTVAAAVHSQLQNNNETNFNHSHHMPEAEGDYGMTTSKRQSRSEDNSERNNASSVPIPDPRFISFQKAGSVGIRLTGGNEVGIFVTAVQPGSPAAQQGLQPGDKILKVNDMDMKGVTREEAVLYLLSLQDQINLIAQYRRDEYDQIVSLQKGDSFYIKAHFNYDQPEKSEMTFNKSDVFHVVDTLHNGVVGSWQAFRMDPFLSGLGRAAEQVQKGVIPNKSRAEEIATKQFNLAKKEQNHAEQKGTSFFRRRKDKSGHHRRSKSLGKDHWEDLVWSESMSKFPAYEKVSLRHPGFPRPVVIFGPVADLARERLLRDFPGKFASPQQAVDVKSSNKSGIVRLTAIRDIMRKDKHALLDVTPNAVDKLNYAQFYPIVIFARADSKQTIKECRSNAPKKAHLSSKKLWEQCQKLEKLWNHVFTSTVTLANITAENQWYSKITELIEKQQTAPIWMSESKPDESVADDFLFPMSSGISYSSAAESDGEFCEPETPRNMSRQPSEEPSSAALSRFNSDPHLNNIEESPVPPGGGGQVEKSENKTRSDSKYGFHHHAQQNGSQQPSNGINESIDDLPLPPHPNTQQSNRNSYNSGSTKNGPSVPPKIERHKKPNRSPRESNTKHNSLDRPSHLNSMKMSVYDAYDPYNFDSSQRTYNKRGSNSNDNGYRSSASMHDPVGYKAPSMPDPGYRAPPPPFPDTPGGYRAPSLQDTSYRTPGENNGYRPNYPMKYPDYKPVPPPKSAPYKPVPPPKPKSSSNNPPEGNYMNNGYASSNSMHYHSSNINNGKPMYLNGNRYSTDDVDSGQGSSLDRDYGLYNNNYAKNNSKDQYYYNLPHNQNGSPTRRENAPVGLDLTNNREYRGSAFELYKKPLTEVRTTTSPPQYYSNQPITTAR